MSYLRPALPRLSSIHCLILCVAAAFSTAAAQDVPRIQTATSASAAPARTREIKWNNPDGPKVPGLEHHSLSSPSMGQEMGFNVWVPAGYAAGTERFPVIYFLHGAGGNENSDAGGFSGLVRSAIEEQRMPPVVCVFPNGGMSGYQDQPERKLLVESFLLKELVPYIDANWRTIPAREGRAVAGFYMGGGGAIRLAVKYPDSFSAAGSWAAAIGFRRPGAAEEFNALLRQNAQQIKDRVRLLLIVGDQDMTYAGHQRVIEQFQALKLAFDYQVLPGVSHDLGRYQRDTGRQLVEFLGKNFRETSLPNPGASPANTTSNASSPLLVMLKLDDLANQKGKNATVPPRWQRLVDFLETEKLKASLGILTESLEGDCPAYCDWIKQHVGKGYIELWDHGYYYRGLPEELKQNGRTAEYLGGTVEQQAAMFEKSLSLMKAKTGLELAAFGPHGTSIDANTYAALEQFPQIRAVWFYGPPKGVKTSKVVIQRLMELERPLFVPNAAQFKENFRNKRAKLPYVAIQGHPNHWDDAGFENFKAVVFYLRDQGCRFVTISEYLAERIDPQSNAK